MKSLDFFLREKEKVRAWYSHVNVEPGPIFYLRLCMCADIVMNEIRFKKRKKRGNNLFLVGKRYLTRSCGVYVFKYI